MSTIHLLGTSSGSRPTNTEHHLSQLKATHLGLSQWDIARANSNAKALEALLSSDAEAKNIALAPFYNVHGKGVRDTMEMIAENYTRLRLLHISRLSVDYILAYHNGASLRQIQQVVTHEQAILQTQKYWGKHGIPNNLQKTGENNTAAGLDYLIDNPGAINTIAISTPWQWRESDSGILTRIDNFGPENNHTYFGIFGLKDSDTGTTLEQKDTDNPEGIEFGVIELEDTQGSLAHALEDIGSNGKNIHSIMSFPQSNGKVLFVVAYSIDNGDAPNISPHTRATISEVYDDKNNEKPYTYRLSIPNSRGSLGRILSAIKHLVDIRSIESVGTSRDDADFIIEIAEQGDSGELLSSIQSILENMNYSPTKNLSASNGNYTFNTLRD